MNPISPPTYVELADGSRIRIIASLYSDLEPLTRLGFRVADEKRRAYERSVESKQEKARLFVQLRDLGVAFARGREWSPVEVFEYLRDAGLVMGPFYQITWSGPGEWAVIPHP